MKLKHQALLAGAIAGAMASAIPFAASAQSSGRTSTTSSSSSSYSFIPTTNNGYVGINLGRPDFDVSCPGGFACENPNLSGKIYTGGLWSNVFGLEVGYIHFGKASRAGGDTKAQGLNISLVGNLPVSVVNVFGKVGTTYSWTSTTALSSSNIVTGDDHGFGLSYGAGVGFDVTRNVQILGEWERHRLQFAGGSNDASLWSVGTKYKF